MTDHSTRTKALIAAGKVVRRARDAEGVWHLDVFVDAILAITEADKVAAVAHERRRVVAEAHRAFVSPWTQDPGAGPGYVLSRRRQDFDRLMQMLPPAAEAGITVDTTTEEA